MANLVIHYRFANRQLLVASEKGIKAGLKFASVYLPNAI